MYAQDYDGRLIPKNTHNGSDWYIWHDLIISYTKNRQIEGCPSLGSQANVWGFKTGYAGVSNHIIADCNHGDYAPALSELDYPATYMMFADVERDADGLRCPACGSNSWANKDFGCTDRHNGGANAVFCDGHAKWLKFNDMYAKPTDPASGGTDYWAHHNDPFLGPGY